MNNANTTEAAFPLAWPNGWPRTQYRRDAPFKCNFEPARQELSAELKRLGATMPVLSTNISIRLDGFPYANQGQPRDPGAAVYFTLKKKRLVLACDRWKKIEHNLRALAKHIEAIRGQERWGVGSVEQAFTGYVALPQTASSEPWWSVLGFREEPMRAANVEAVIETMFRSLVKTAHPDHGGTVEQFQRITQAREFGLQWAKTGAA